MVFDVAKNNVWSGMASQSDADLCPGDGGK